jgi:hypothetical protein
MLLAITDADHFFFFRGKPEKILSCAESLQIGSGTFQTATKIGFSVTLF